MRTQQHDLATKPMRWEITILVDNATSPQIQELTRQMKDFVPQGLDWDIFVVKGQTRDGRVYTLDA